MINTAMNSIYRLRLATDIFFVTTILSAVSVFGMEPGQLIKIGSCTCPDNVITYHCIINGSNPGGFTIWQGTAFNCPTEGNRILLRHNLFNSRAFGSCNDENIIGESVGVSIGSTYVYTSRLVVNITADPSLIGRRVECIYTPNGVKEISVDSMTINVTGPLPPPFDVRLVSVTSNKQLTFHWKAVQVDCSTLRYFIESDCGTCPMNPVATTSANCSFQLPLTSASGPNFCNFSVRSIICNDVIGSKSIPVNITLKVPESPVIRSVVPTYGEDDELVKVAVDFEQAETFNISNGIDGSALYYIVNISDSKTNAVCNLINVSTNSCLQRVCAVSNSDLAHCTQDDFIISVSGFNQIGKGLASNTYIAKMNAYVDVTFESSRRILCTFTERSGSQNDKSCDIMYGSCGQQLAVTVVGRSTSTSTVVIDFPELQSGDYCYIIRASNSTYTVQVQGVFSGDRSSVNVVAVTTIFALLGLTVITVVAIVLIVLAVRFKRRKSSLRRHGLPRSLTETGISLLSKSEMNTELEYQTVTAHIIFKIEDKLVELIKALRTLSMIINIKNIKICPCNLEENQTSQSIVYIECDDDLSEEDKEAIKELKLSDLEVYTTFPYQQVVKDKEHSSEHLMEISEILQCAPEALCSLLKVFQDTEKCGHINITDISHEDVQERNDCRRVKIKLLPQVPEDWSTNYNKKRNNCKFIINEDTTDTMA